MTNPAGRCAVCKREARLGAARLAHPSIISAIDMGVQNGRWWYAMELVEVKSLLRRIAERGSLRSASAWTLQRPVRRAPARPRGRSRPSRHQARERPRRSPRPSPPRGSRPRHGRERSARSRGQDPRSERRTTRTSPSRLAIPPGGHPERIWTRLAAGCTTRSVGGRPPPRTTARRARVAEGLSRVPVQPVVDARRSRGKERRKRKRTRPQMPHASPTPPARTRTVSTGRGHRDPPTSVAGSGPARSQVDASPPAAQPGSGARGHAAAFDPAIAATGC